MTVRREIAELRELTPFPAAAREICPYPNRDRNRAEAEPVLGQYVESPKGEPDDRRPVAAGVFMNNAS